MRRSRLEFAFLLLCALIERAPDGPPGTPLAVELGPPAAALFEYGVAPSPSRVEAWRSGALQLITGQSACEASAGAVRRIAIGYPHFGVIQTWKGESAEGEPAAPMPRIAEELADMYGTWIALEIERPCAKGAVLALPPGAPAPTVFPPLETDPALRARGRLAFAALPAVRSLTREERKELEAELSVSVFGRGRPEWLVAGGATGCALDITQLALFRVDGDRLVLQLTKDIDLYSIWTLVDLDGDGQPEIGGTPWDALAADRKPQRTRPPERRYPLQRLPVLKLGAYVAERAAEESAGVGREGADPLA